MVGNNKIYEKCSHSQNFFKISHLPKICNEYFWIGLGPLFPLFPAFSPKIMVKSPFRPPKILIKWWWQFQWFWMGAGGALLHKRGRVTIRRLWNGCATVQVHCACGTTMVQPASRPQAPLNISTLLLVLSPERALHMIYKLWGIWLIIYMHTKGRWIALLPGHPQSSSHWCTCGALCKAIIHFHLLTSISSHWGSSSHCILTICQRHKGPRLYWVHKLCLTDIISDRIPVKLEQKCVKKWEQVEKMMKKWKI